jgi:DNA-nicking Smr family endonuclease
MKKMKIDLHGMKHHHAKQYLQLEIDNLINTNVEVEIVTGRSPKMIAIAKEVLSEYKLDAREDEWLYPGVVKTEC